jgi:hypothetical protein
MSWKSISNNQTVSRANLQNAIDTGIFVAKNGVPSSEPNKQITKANAQDYINTWDLYPPFLSKSSNRLPVKSNLAVQSNELYADSFGLYVGNNNRSWTYQIFSNSSTTQIGSVASSKDNRCILIGKKGPFGGGAWVSNNYGESFRALNEVLSTNDDAALSTAMSTNGELMILTRQVDDVDGDIAKIYRSYNSGENWVVGYEDGVRYNFNGAAMSGVGNYATVLGSDGDNYYVFTSNTFGASYTKTYLCQGTKTLVTNCVGMSKSGQYQLLTPPSPTGASLGYYYVSNNWGASWTAYTQVTAPFVPNDIFLGCSVSAGGDYMTVAAYSSTFGEYFTYISSDFGVNWVRRYSNTAGAGQAIDSSGQFRYKNGFKSEDYGGTWIGTEISASVTSINQTTFSTPYIYGTTSGGNLYKSATQGGSFSILPVSGYFTKVATSGGSNNGKYVAAIKDNNPGGFPNYNLYQSSDYGATWSTVLSSAGQVMTCCAVSDDGVYWIAATYDGPANTSYIYRSHTGGATWDYVYEFFGSPVSCDISGSGEYSTIVFYSTVGNFSTLLRSNDYGANWIQPSSSLGFQFQNKEITDVSISNSGRFRMITTRVGNAQGRVYFSDDYGVTFNQTYYDDDYGMDFCDMDNSGRVCMAGGKGAYTVMVNYTINTWNSYYTWQPPTPLYPPVGFGGVNISSDATYWTIAVNFGVGGGNPFVYTYTSIDAGATWTQNTLSPVVNDFKMLSK